MGRPPGAGVGRAPAQLDIICTALSLIEPGTLLGCKWQAPLAHLPEPFPSTSASECR